MAYKLLLSSTFAMLLTAYGSDDNTIEAQNTPESAPIIPVTTTYTDLFLDSAVGEFSYDGGGPDVYFYGAKDHQYVSAEAFPLGPKINGQSYKNASIILKLLQNKSLDDLNGLSVWCVDFAANFGQMEFTP